VTVAHLRLALASLLVVGALAGDAAAHPLAPALLEIRETGGGRAEMRWRPPVHVTGAARMAPVLPSHCHPTGKRLERDADLNLEVHWTVDCGSGGLTGGRISVEGLAATGAVALVRVVLVDGRVVDGVLRASDPVLLVPERPGRLDVFWTYCGLGAEHILVGPDHLLFVFGLLLLVPALRPLVQTITAFTAGHSVTLSLAVLDVARVPQNPVEVLIAATVLALALELARPPAPTLMRRYPWAMALAFGLLHGLGFAGALREVGLPHGAIPLALFSFNAGIEIGQLLFVLVILVARQLLASRLERLPRWARRAPIYAMGSLAAFWCVERAAALFG
jgi:hypothetical protein